VCDVAPSVDAVTIEINAIARDQWCRRDGFGATPGARSGAARGRLDHRHGGGCLLELY
jgi:hypothetical protein